MIGGDSPIVRLGTHIYSSIMTFLFYPISHRPLHTQTQNNSHMFTFLAKHLHSPMSHHMPIVTFATPLLGLPTASTILISNRESP